jgi:hypothetical protein
MITVLVFGKIVSLKLIKIENKNHLYFKSPWSWLKEKKILNNLDGKYFSKKLIISWISPVNQSINSI